MSIANIIKFAHSKAYEWYHCLPSETPEHIFFNQENNEITTTVGITNHYPHQVLPLQHLYKIETIHLPHDWQWARVIQLSWFFNSKPGCFMPLLLKALQSSLTLNKTYGILQMKAKVCALLSKKGLRLVEINQATLASLSGPEKENGYYLDSDPIGLYYLDIAANIESIQTYLAMTQSSPSLCNQLTMYYADHGQ